MNLFFTAEAWTHYLHWVSANQKVQAKINALLEDVARHPFVGLGKPEALRGKLAGYWSRRITREHRLTYRIEGRGEDQQIRVVACRFHYDL